MPTTNIVYSNRYFNGLVSKDIRLPRDFLITPVLKELQALNEELVHARERRKELEKITGRKMKPLSWRGAIPALAEIATLTMVENIGRNKCLTPGDLHLMGKEWGFSDLINPKNEPYVFRNVEKKLRDQSQRQLSIEVLDILRQHKIEKKEFYSGGMPRKGLYLKKK